MFIYYNIRILIL